MRKIAGIKWEDENKFRLLGITGVDVYDISDLDKTDEYIEKICKDYNTVLISELVASNSEDIIKKYSYKDNINIIIM